MSSMRNLRTPFLLLALALFPLAVMAGEPTDQISISLDAVGQGFFFFNGNGNPANSQFGLGGTAFVDYRFLKALSLGFGGEYLLNPNNTISLASLDLGGRIFPVVLDRGEIYLLGGLGYNVVRNVPHPGHYHGYAGLGYRHFLDKNLALDLGIQYDFWSPILAPNSGVGVRLGMTFLFGKERWSSDEIRKASVDAGGWSSNPLPGTYVWKPGDSLKKIAARELGAEGLFPSIVDANPGIFSDLSNLKVGMEIRMPANNFTDAQIEQFTAEALSDKYRRLDRHTSHLPYPHDPRWKGPKTYRWQVGDSMPSVASKLYDDEDLYPILVDANEERLIHPVNLIPGVILKVPPPPSEEWLDYIHQEAWDKAYYQWWKNVSGPDQP